MGVRVSSSSLVGNVNNAAIAQLVEHNLAKVGVASSSLVCRSIKGHTGRRNGGIGRHEGLKIPWPVMAVRVRVPFFAHSNVQVAELVDALL